MEKNEGGDKNAPSNKSQILNLKEKENKDKSRSKLAKQKYIKDNDKQFPTTLNGSFNTVDNKDLVSDNESDKRSTISQKLHQVSLLNPQEASIPGNKAELLHQRMVSKSKGKKEGTGAEEGKETKKRTIVLDKSAKLTTQPKTKMSALGTKDFSYKPEDSSGIEILDLHRKIVEEVSQVKFDESLVVVEHIPKNQVLCLHLLNLKGTPCNIHIYDYVY